MRRIYLYLYKFLLNIADSFVSFIQKIPKIFGGVFLCFGLFLFEGLKVCLAFAVLATAAYYIAVLLYKLISKKVDNSLNSIRLRQHDINCGLYMIDYQKKLNSTDDIDKMLSFKELLETNILLSSLKYKVKMLFTESNVLNYENILNNGLAVGNALCFSGKSSIKQNEQNKNEFVIDTNVFVKEFNEYCKNDTDVYDQINFIKERQKQIKENL